VTIIGRDLLTVWAVSVKTHDRDPGFKRDKDLLHTTFEVLDINKGPLEADESYHKFKLAFSFE